MAIKTSIEKTNYFSPKTGKFYQLLPTRTIPVLKINSVPMQRYATLDPLTDTKLKILAAQPKGRVLDICTGLGYTAIEAARRKEVAEVITLEQDEEVLEIARINPASRELFKNKKINIKVGNAAETIRDFPQESFDIIIHDPPTFTMAPELYHSGLYRQLFRVLKQGGTLWHYAPRPGKAKTPAKADKFVANIIRRLKETGFVQVFYEEKSCGILAKKK